MYAILADDLTGAADAGVEFAQAGWRTRTLRRAWVPTDLPGASVAVIDTGTRACTPAAAYTCVQGAATRLGAAGARVVFKKIDSTLRGPLGAELDAMLDALFDAGHPALAVICPAFPATGRRLVGGVLLVDGVPVAQSASGRDPITPVQESHLPTLLASQSLRPVLACPRPLRKGIPDEIAADWRALLPAGGLLVVDAEDEDDLALIAQAALAAPEEILLVGSAGLARPLAAGLPALNAAGRGASLVTPPNPAGRATCPAAPADAASDHVGQVARATHTGAPVLVVCGSLHPAARAQMRAVAAQFDARTVTLLATPEPVAAKTVAAGADSQEAARTLALAALATLSGQPAAGVVVTGGDTLESLLESLGARGVDLERALAPGVPIGRIAGGAWAGLAVVSKAGGFGDEGVLVRAVRALLEYDHETANGFLHTE